MVIVFVMSVITMAMNVMSLMAREIDKPPWSSNIVLYILGLMIMVISDKDRNRVSDDDASDDERCDGEIDKHSKWYT